MIDTATSGAPRRPEPEQPIRPTRRALPPRPPAAPARPRRRIVARALAGVAAAAALGGIVLALIPEPVTVDLGAVSRGPLEVTVDEDGRTRVKDRFTVSAPLTGLLVRPSLRAGDSVRRGEVVARIVPAAAPLLDPRARAEAEARASAASAALRRAAVEAERVRAELEFARRETARQRTLLAAGAAAVRTMEQVELAERMRAEELASAEHGRRVAAAELELARAALRRLDASALRDGGFAVPSPAAGVVLRLLQESEAVVQSGTPLLEIGDPASLEVVVDVLSGDVVGIRPGAPVLIERWGGEGALRGHVHRVEPSAFTRISALGVEEQRVNVVIDFDGDPGAWAVLGDGYRVETRIVVAREDSALQVPAGAVFRHEGGWAVYVVEQGRARLRPIELGRRNPSHAEVRAGLSEGRRVVVYPSDNLTDGTRVEGR